MDVVDAQLHDPAPRLEWPADPAVRRPLQTELALAALDAVGVSAAIFDVHEDASWPTFAAEHFPSRFAVVDRPDPLAPDVDDRVTALRSHPAMVAARITAVAGERFEALRTGLHEPTLAACERHDVPLFLFATVDLTVVAKIARAHPGLTLIVDHLGLRQPPMESPDDPPFRSLPALLALAELPNVAVKVSGAPTLSHEPYPYGDLWPHLHRIVDAFGPERLMWGSDIQRVAGRIGFDLRWPAGEAAYPGKHNYAESLGFLLHTDELGDADKEQILGGTVRRLLRWPIPPSLPEEALASLVERS